MTDPVLTRPYRGVPADDRVAARREALIDAALAVFADEGWAAISARRVCERAALTRGYFYESFDGVDALIAAAFARITGEVRAAVRGAVGDGIGPVEEIARRAVSAGLDALTTPPSKGRFLVTAQSANGSIMPHPAAAVKDPPAVI